MSHKFLLNASFHSLLNTIDQELADKTRQQGCVHCAGALHQADYPRSPFGLPAQWRFYYEERLSFCCVLCRRRATPPSVRFFGRRWFPAPLLVLISALVVGINERRLAQVKHHFGITVSESTWKRWRRWWRESFTVSSFWLEAKGRLVTFLEPTGLFPRALFSLTSGTLAIKMNWLLRFLLPLTGLRTA